MATNSKSPVEQAKEILTTRADKLREEIKEHEEALGKARSEMGEIEVMLNPPQPEPAPEPTPASVPAPTARQSASQNGNGPSGQRAQQFLDLVKAKPGITVSQAAKEMDLTQANYLYRIRTQLVEQGLIRREGQGLVAV